jgi:hypothetical protein
VSSASAEPVARLSALRLVSFVPAERDSVHVGLLSPDALHVIDLAPLGINDAHEAIEQIDMLRQTAGAIVHGAARTAFEVKRVHLVAPVPLVRSVIAGDGAQPIDFADPATLHGPGGHISRTDAATARAGLGVVIGRTIEATLHCADETLDAAIIGSVVVLGWAHTGHAGETVVRPGALGPFLAVPRRAIATLTLTRVCPVVDAGAADDVEQVPAPGADAFVALARAALRTHTLRPGDLLTIFPPSPADEVARAPMLPGSWVRVSAPSLGTLSIAVR